MLSQSVSQKDSGFTTARTVLLIVAVIVVAAAAYLIVRSLHKSPIPIKSSNSSQQSTAQSTAKKPTAQNPCLTLADLRSYAYTPISKVAQDTPIARAYFKADSTDYNPKLMPGSKPVGASAYQLYQATTGKDYQFTVTASTSEESTSESGQQLAAARADKTKNELISRGIPAAKITILPPTHGLAGGDLTRYAYIGVRVPESCVTT